MDAASAPPGRITTFPIDCEAGGLEFTGKSLSPRGRDALASGHRHGAQPPVQATPTGVQPVQVIIRNGGASGSELAAWQIRR
jgi:hypothetical protein